MYKSCLFKLTDGTSRGVVAAMLAIHDSHSGNLMSPLAVRCIIHDCESSLAVRCSIHSCCIVKQNT